MSRGVLRGVAVVCLGVTLGCATTVVKKDPGPNDQGVRFYRPKPYLSVQAFGESKAVKSGDSTTTTVTNLTDRQVTMKLEWLPDFAEEYAINAKTGIGKNETAFKLENGWNLTEFNVKIDSKVPENIEAVAKLLEAVPKAAAVFTSGGAGDAPGAAVVVAATNVPLGYYESVISKGPDGKKRLYGWRYVGFMPYATCPVEGAGVACAPCDSACVYGLGFENGVMTFRPLQTMATAGASLQTQNQYTGTNVRSVVDQVMAASKIKPEQYAVTYELTGAALTVNVTLDPTLATQSAGIKTKLELQLRGTFTPNVTVNMKP